MHSYLYIHINKQTTPNMYVYIYIYIYILYILGPDPAEAREPLGSIRGRLQVSALATLGAPSAELRPGLGHAGLSMGSAFWEPSGSIHISIYMYIYASNMYMYIRIYREYR